MKKILVVICMLFACAGIGFAQTAPAKSKKAPAAKEATSGPVKKDGTPDMRYKKNQAGADTVKHKKKDGTPDKRFKENKKG